MRTVFPDDRVEDRLKAEFFGDKRDGFFVEVGANDPQRGSQTWQFERIGWSGVLIEPQPDLAARLRGARRARVVAAACSSPDQAGRLMPLYLSGPYSSLDAKLAVTTIKPEGAVEVPVRTLDDILAEANAPSPVDFVSIDVEGHELAVLEGFDVARWRPRLILLEDHLISLSAHRHLSESGYRLIRRTGLNGWYVPRREAPALGLGSLQLVRKYYLGLPVRIVRERKRRLRDRLRRGLAARPQGGG